MEAEALTHMVYRLDNRPPGSNGYVTNVAELSKILHELSDLVPVGIQLATYQVGDDVSVKISLGFTIEREHLG